MTQPFYFVTFSDINNGVPHHAVAGPFYTHKSSELHRANTHWGDTRYKTESFTSDTKEQRPLWATNKLSCIFQ